VNLDAFNDLKNLNIYATVIHRPLSKKNALRN